MRYKIKKYRRKGTIKIMVSTKFEKKLNGLVEKLSALKVTACVYGEIRMVNQEKEF